MTVHMIEVRCEGANIPIEKARQAVQKWAGRREEVRETERMAITKVTGDEEQNFPEHLHGRWRFTLTEDKNTLISDIENALQEVVRWYYVAYHACDHDEDEVRGCRWNRVERFGNIPESITAPEVV